MFTLGKMNAFDLDLDCLTRVENQPIEYNFFVIASFRNESGHVGKRGMPALNLTCHQTLIRLRHIAQTHALF